jgi:hypothetical protein
MIVKNELIDLLFEESPGFQEFISEEIDAFKQEKLYHVILGCYAHYLFTKYKNNDLHEIKKGFTKLEFLLINGDNEVKNIIKLGFFESFQNILLTENIDLSVFDEFISPNSKKAWDEIIDFWNKKNM